MASQIRSYMTISIDVEKAFEKIQHLFKIKTLNIFGTKGICLIIIMAIFDKPTASIIFSGEKLKAFSLRPGTIQGCHLSHLFNIVLEVTLRAIRQERKIPSSVGVIHLLKSHVTLWDLFCSL